jgi:hypothetical protein
LRRGYLLGYRRARRKARAEMNSLADEIEALQEDFAEIELELHRDRALDEAIVERATTELLH